MACFACKNNKNGNQVRALLAYQAAHLRTGINYVFYKKIGTNDIKITTIDGFKAFRACNKADFRKKRYEFSLISEFRNVVDSRVLEDNGDKPGGEA